MTHPPGGGERAEPPLANALEGPARDESALVFAVKEPRAVRSAEENFRDGKPVTRGLEQVFRYLADRPGAELTRLGRGQPGTGPGNYRGEPPPHAPGALPEIGYLRLDAPEDGRRLQEALRGDPAVRYAEAPAIHYVLDPAPAAAPSPGPPRDAYERLWWLHKCGFPEVWDQLERGDSAPRPIGVIDQGTIHGHPELADRVDSVDVLPPGSIPSSSVHAASVAGVIAAIRGERAPDRMAGCCSARVTLYNVFTHERFSPLAYYRALEAVAEARLPVLNLSLGSREPDSAAADLLGRCRKADVVLVAAVGDFAREGSPPTYPSAHEDVIGVGATDRSDQPTETSCRGPHVWISAPGQDIFTLYGSRFREERGTSYSAAMVSAAVWLARRRKPECGAAEIKELLAKSAAGTGTRTDALGHGRLDMAKLARALETMPCGRVYRGGQPVRMRGGAP
jgi:hypothetical protein